MILNVQIKILKIITFIKIQRPERSHHIRNYISEWKKKIEQPDEKTKINDLKIILLIKLF